jgi:L-arabinokinase
MAEPLTFVYFVSGQGFGLASRVVEITSHLIAAGHCVHIVGQAPHTIWLQSINCPKRLIFRNALVDSFAIQSDALTVDRMKSLLDFEAIFERQEEIVEAEATYLREVKADLVVVDIAPMACTAAARAGVRCVAVTNFSWDYIYAEYIETQGVRFRAVCEKIAQAYSKADLLLRVPGFTPMPAFRRVEDVPLVVRMARTPRDAIRARYGLQPDQKVVVFNFGGAHPETWKLEESFLPAGWVCIVCTALPTPTLPPNFIKAPADEYTPDLIDATDVLLGKVGYGTVSEAVAHLKPFVWVRRDYFNEQVSEPPPMAIDGAPGDLMDRH